MTSISIEQWLSEATEELSNANIESARLDAELILAHTLRRPRTYLHAHGDEPLKERQEDIATARLELRLDHTPIAYIVGHKGFYGRQFKTTPAALIPRPETETMIDLLGEVMPKNLPLLPERLQLVDVGTGTGCLGITAKLEWPELNVTLTDISNHALNLARENAELLGADIEFLKTDLLRGYELPIDIVLANLPYVDRRWKVSPDVHAEPEQALYAASDGLALIHKLIRQAAVLMNPSGHLFLESDPRQQALIIAFAKDYGFTHRRTEGYITSFTKN